MKKYIFLFAMFLLTPLASMAESKESKCQKMSEVEYPYILLSKAEVKKVLHEEKSASGSFSSSCKATTKLNRPFKDEGELRSAREQSAKQCMEIPDEMLDGMIAMVLEQCPDGWWKE